eukprot:1945194-Rhodomonas_salina.2
MSAFATSLRSVLAVMPSQKTFTPPATTGIDAESVVFICHGSPPAFGAAVPLALATVSMAETTRLTKTLLSSTSDAAGNQSIPSAILKETKPSGTEEGLLHMAAAGAHSWVPLASSGSRARVPGT